MCRLCCIAPVLAAKVIPGCELTVGSDQEEDGKWPYAGTAGAIGSMGSKHVKKDVTVSFEKTSGVHFCVHLEGIEVRFLP